MKRFGSLLKNELITGMVLLAPVAGTAYLVYLIVSGIDGLFPEELRPKLLGHPLPGLGVLSVLVIRSRRGSSWGVTAAVVTAAVIPVQAMGPRGCSRRSGSDRGFGRIQRRLGQRVQLMIDQHGAHVVALR